MTDVRTFRQLEAGVNSNEPATADSSLDEWYRRVRDIPIGELDHGDLGRACRQRLHLDQVVPIAIARLESQPLAGSVYDGELLVAMKSVPTRYWQKNPLMGEQLVGVVERVKQLAEDEDIIADADRLLGRIRRGS